MFRQEFAINSLRLIWAVCPDIDDIARLEKIFPFHPLVIESIKSPTLHPLIEDYGDHLFLILRLPIIYQTRQANNITEIDFLITKNILVVITYIDFRDLDEILGNLLKGYAIQKGTMPKNHTGYFLHFIIDRLFQKLIRDLDIMEEEITKIEDKIFQKHDHALVEEISHARRDILDFKRPLNPLPEVLKIFAEKAEKLYGKAMKPYFANLVLTNDRLVNLIGSQKETIEILNQTNESLLSSTISNIITVLTIFSAVILPLNFIASIWGMNQRLMPLRDGRFDFWIIVGIMARLALLLIWFFRKKRWL